VCPPPEQLDDDVTAILSALEPTAPQAHLFQHLKALLRRDGLHRFVTFWLPVLNNAVGKGWADHRLEVFAEHRYTTAVTQVLARAMPVSTQPAKPPCVLLATPPGEQHGLALLALQALFSLEGAHCINLGVDLPCGSLGHAARAFGARAVGLSMSVGLSAGRVNAAVRQTLAALPPDCELWLGGEGCAKLDPVLCSRAMVYDDVASAVQRWRGLHDAINFDL